MTAFLRKCHLPLPCLILLLLTAARPELKPSNDHPNTDQSQAIQEFAKIFPGDIVFDSNRGDGFGIHILNLSSGAISPLVDTDREEMYPGVSPDGKWVAFARSDTQKKRSSSAIFLIPSHGGEEVKLADNATFPTFSADGKAIYFERDREHVMRLELESKKETEVFPRGNPEWAGFSIVKPHISPNEKFVTFITERPRRWSSWYVDLSNSKSFHVGAGCEPSWFSTSDKIAWVSGESAKERAGISSLELQSRKVAFIQDADAPRGHEYFPTLESKDRFLLYGAARPKEHTPTTANYQLFAKDFSTGKVVRLTFDRFTNRWPKLLPKN